jgi:ABC-type bacteriocin/lantibiotic exporter with double-glycine peptidase domain
MGYKHPWPFYIGFSRHILPWKVIVLTPWDNHGFFHSKNYAANRKGDLRMKRIFKYVWEYKLLVLIPSIAMTLSIGLDMFNPYLQQLITDRVFIGGELDILWYILEAS